MAAPKASFDRRSVVKGAAWSVPVIAAAIAAPAAAASAPTATAAFDALRVKRSPPCQSGASCQTRRRWNGPHGVSPSRTPRGCHHRRRHSRLDHDHAEILQRQRSQPGNRYQRHVIDRAGRCPLNAGRLGIRSQCLSRQPSLRHADVAGKCNSYFRLWATTTVAATRGARRQLHHGRHYHRSQAHRLPIATVPHVHLT